MEMFLTRSLENIQRDLNPKKSARLKESCVSTLELVKQVGVTPKSYKIDDIEQSDKVVNKLINTLKLACETGQAIIMSHALDCIEKLLAYGYIRPSMKDLENPERKLMDKVIKTIEECFDYDDANVQLQILKAFLTAVSSNHCNLHEQALLGAIRGCINVYLNSKSSVNQRTAKATLSQIINIVYQRYEQAAKEQLRVSSQPLGNHHDENPSELRGFSVSAARFSISSQPSNENKSESDADHQLEEKNEYIPNEDLPAVTEDIPDEVSDKHDPLPQISSTHQTVPITEEALNIAFFDCFSIFRFLCKLSMAELAAPVQSNSLDLRRKLLTMELLQLMVESTGPMLRINDNFIDNAIKKYLFISLLFNGVSPYTRVFRSSLELFNSLIFGFQDYLKNEIGVFFSKILLRILSSSNSSIKQKQTVLESLLKICNQPQTLVALFLNYDCNIDSADIFERTVNEISAISKTPRTYPLTIDESAVRILSLQCLVTILQSMVQWTQVLADEQQHHTEEHQREEHPAVLENSNSSSDLDNFTKQKHWKSQVEHGKKLFNFHPNKGLRYLFEIGHLKEDPVEVAKFFMSTEGLDLNKVGEYLGNIGNPFCKAVLYAYIDFQQFKFEDKDIYTALHQLLLGFRLPGESQKIDVIVEKFAERYYNDNKSNPNFLFRNADAVYLFAFHMVMLATDLHSTAIRHKMTKLEWIKNNSGLNDGTDFPVKFLEDIYDAISKNPLTTKEYYQIRASNLHHPGLLSPKQRMIQFHQESQLIVQKTQNFILEQLKIKAPFFKSNNIEHVKPMFEVCWCPVMAALSMNLENSQDDDLTIWNLCLDGYKCAIRVSSVFFMETERSAFVSSLSQCTLLSNRSEMKPKNIQAIKCLIQIAEQNGNYLQDSWYQVLSSISRLAKILAIAQSNPKFELPDPLHSPKTIRKNVNYVKRESLDFSVKLFEGLNATCVAENIDAEQIDKIFSKTVQLSDNAIVEFVKSLCRVSIEEVEHATPRTYSLQKLIEVAAFNMERIRFVWSRIWHNMAEHFQYVACHNNLKISMYAIDSLRQLSMKFLEKDELTNYHFQKDFLQPFEWIIVQNQAAPIRELVVQCLVQMVMARATNIKSGWKSIFFVFTFVGGESDKTIVFLVHNVIHNVVKENFALISSGFFVECVNCLVSLAKNRHFKIVSMQAVEALGTCAEYLAQGSVIPLGTPDDQGSVFTDNDQAQKCWFPILTGLAEVVNHPHVDVRTTALDVLFNTLERFGQLFSGSLWELIFRGVLLPIFNNVRSNEQGRKLQEDNEWLTSTCLHALTRLVTLFSNFFDRVSFFYRDFMILFVGCILQENQHLAFIGIDCLVQLISKNSTKWTSPMWNVIWTVFKYLIQANHCEELLTWGNQVPTETLRSNELYEDDSQENSLVRNELHSSQESSLDALLRELKRATSPKLRLYDVNVILGKLNVQIQLLTAIYDIASANLDILDLEHLALVFDCLESAHAFAYSANNTLQIWKTTGKSGIMKLMVKQESFSVHAYLGILFNLYASSSEDRAGFVEERLLEILKNIMQDFLAVDETPSNYPTLYSTSKVNIALQALKGLYELKDNQFQQHIPKFFKLLSDLVLVSNRNVRAQVKELFVRVGHLRKFVQ